MGMYSTPSFRSPPDVEAQLYAQEILQARTISQDEKISRFGVNSVALVIYCTYFEPKFLVAATLL